MSILNPLLRASVPARGAVLIGIILGVIPLGASGLGALGVPTPTYLLTTISIGAAVALGVVGLLAGRSVARAAALSSSQRHVYVDGEAEQNVLALLLREPSLYPAVGAALNPPDFAWEPNRRVWEALVAAVGDGAAAEEEWEVSVKALRLHERHSEIDASLAQSLSADESSWAQQLRSREVEISPAADESGPEKLPEGWVDRKQTLLSHAALVMENGLDRSEFPAPLKPVEGPGPDQPLILPMVEPSPARTAFAAVALGVSFALAPLLAATQFQNPVAQVAAVGAFLVLAITSMVIALVDYDTLLVDLRVLKGGGLVAWLLVITADLIEGVPERIVLGLFVVVMLGLVMEMFSLIHKLIRKRAGFGRGDTFILIATVGIPVALTNSASLGVRSVVWGMVLAVGGYVVMRLRGQIAGREVPFGLGPYLVFGWILTWALRDILPM